MNDETTLDLRRQSKRTKVRQGTEYQESKFDAQYDKYYGTRGTQHFQQKYKQGFSLLQSKYTQAANFLGIKLKKEEESFFIFDTFKKW